MLTSSIKFTSSASSFSISRRRIGNSHPLPLIARASSSPSPNPPNPIRQILTSVVSAVSELGAKSTPSDPNMSALWNAIKRSDEEALQTALAGGANVNERDSNGDTPLLFIARQGHYKYPPAKLPTMLVKSGADLEVKDGKGFTALEVSLMSGWQNISYLLLENGAKTGGVAAIKGRLTCPDCKRVVAEYKL